MSRELLEYTVEDLARRNGAQLLAAQLQSEIRDRLEQFARHQEELRDMRTLLDEAQRIGVAVLRAKRAGRKTVRIDEVTS